MDPELVRISRFLSYALRHRPEEAGVRLDAQGWASVDVLIRAATERGFALDRPLLARIVRENDKQRFSLDGDRIRANQGPSVAVDLGLAPAAPPALLYHGTSRSALAGIRESGLHRRGRHYVHLSGDAETALAGGRRHGRPVVLTVEAGAMAEAGHAFYRSANGVWLTGHVPVRFLQVTPDA